MHNTIKKLLLGIYFLTRLPLIMLIKLIFPVREQSSAEPKKILIIRIDRIGDLVLTLPVIDNLRRRYPQSDIDILVKPYLKDLASLIKGIHRVIVYKGCVSLHEIRHAQYDVALDMLYDYRLDSAFLAFFTGAAARVGFSWGFRELLFNRVVDPLRFPRAHMAELHLELLRAINVPIVQTIPQISIEGKKAGSEQLIVIHPVGFYQSQRWPADRFICLAKRLLEVYQVKIKVIGAPQDKPLVQAIVSGIDHPQAEAAVQGLKDTVFLLSGSLLLIANHSGPMHLAAALGVPTVSMMGPADPLRWRPVGENNIVLRKELACSPCSLGVCGRHDCMRGISVDEAFDAAAKLLEKVYGIKADK